MTKKVNGWSGLVVLVSVGLLSGCINVKVDADGWAQKGLSKLEKKQAVSIAKSKARDEGYNVDQYVVTANEAKGQSGGWWVLFDKPRPQGDHFSVFVDAEGKATLRRGE